MTDEKIIDQFIDLVTDDKPHFGIAMDEDDILVMTSCTGEELAMMLAQVVEVNPGAIMILHRVIEAYLARSLDKPDDGIEFDLGNVKTKA